VKFTFSNRIHPRRTQPYAVAACGKPCSTIKRLAISV
jgi:hypothetical protein